MAQRSFKLSDDLDARLEAAAKADGRTVSNLIVWTLEQALSGSTGFAAPPTDKSPVGSGRHSPRPAAPARTPNASEGTPLPKIAPRRTR